MKGKLLPGWGVSGTKQALAVVNCKEGARLGAA